MTDAQRLLEYSFPVKEISEISAKEKNIRHGHISTLHIWWARRPLAVSRATIYAALTPAPKDKKEFEERKKFLIELSKWENSNNPKLLERARKEILEANGGTPPKVIDPFAGGGSYPLEALRLGCESYANDYNPVAVLIEKAILQGVTSSGKNFSEPASSKGKLHFNEQDGQTLLNHDIHPLISAVEQWGDWVLEEAKKELSEFYKCSHNNETPVGYIWARTIPCQNPACGVEIPLMRQYWLAKKEKKKIALHPISQGAGKPILFEIVSENAEQENYKPWPKKFNPDEGTISRARVCCPACGSMIDDKTTRKLFQTGSASEKMVVVVTTGASGKKYRLATKEDEEVFEKAKLYLEQKIQELRETWGMEPVPEESTPSGKGGGAERAFSVQNYGMYTYGDLFNPRQKLALLVFANAVRRVYENMVTCGYLEEWAKVIILYLSFGLNRLLDQSSSFVPWITQLEAVAHTFNRQALGMVWDYVECSPFIYYHGAISWIKLVLQHLSQIPTLNSNLSTSVTQGSATSLPYPDNTFDAVFTDPPYYDNVPYSYLSDFFYVWSKRTIGHLFPELFSTPLTPKSKEIVAYTQEGSLEKGMKFFEEQLSLAFKEMYRILKPNGIAVIVYAHKSTAGWETVINALLESGLVVDASWPINTEMQSRLRAKDSAALASSIYIVARKKERTTVGMFAEVLSELKRYMNQKLDFLWEEGIGGADFFISAIGAGIEVFGKYKEICDYDGNVIYASTMLEEIRKLATDYAVHKILENGFAEEINPLTRFYLLYRWEYAEAKAPFDEVRKLATSVGIDLSLHWNRGFIQKEKEFIYLLSPNERKISDLQNSTEIIDVLHYVLLLWEKGEREKIVKHLKQTGYGTSEIFYRVAQAISETLPQQSKEKKLLDGFLVGRDRTQREVSELKEQLKLF